jgi:hypothetical protein
MENEQTIQTRAVEELQRWKELLIETLLRLVIQVVTM